MISQLVSMWLFCLNLTKSYPSFVIRYNSFAGIRCTGQKLLNETLKERLKSSAMTTSDSCCHKGREVMWQGTVHVWIRFGRTCKISSNDTVWNWVKKKVSQWGSLAASARRDKMEASKTQCSVNSSMIRRQKVKMWWSGQDYITFNKTLRSEGTCSRLAGDKGEQKELNTLGGQW